MEVSQDVKNEYKSNSITKHVTLHFPELGIDIGMQNIYYESFRLTESLIEKESMEFVGCNASRFKIQVNGLKADIKGKKIIVEIATDGTMDDPITLFHGIVDSAMKQSNKQIKEIVAYDELYTKGNIDVAAWYKSLTFPISLKNLRDSLFNYIGIEQVDTSLPNDGVVINRQYDPNTLQALAVIKAICQINGAFGIINRENKFEYRIVGKISDVPYPSETLFPSEFLFPASPAVALAAAERKAEEINAESFSFYKKVDYEEYEVKPIDKVTIRQSENEAGVTYGNGTNNYIIQGNMFTYGLSNADLISIAENVYNSIGGFAYYPFTSDNNGLPFLECGLDAVSYYMIDYENSTSDNVVYDQKSFYILNREMTGIQNLRDSYKAKGEEYQSEFITDLQTQIDLLKRNQQVDIQQQIEDYTYSSEEIDNMFEQFDPGGGSVGFNILSVKSMPTNPQDNTVYFVQGEVVVI